MSPEDHHSEYLARALGALTVAGRERVDELLDGLAEAAGGREQLTRFARVRRAEADSGQANAAATSEPAETLSSPELDALLVGFKTIRDTEQRDDVTDWANAVLALLEDEKAGIGA